MGWEGGREGGWSRRREKEIVISAVRSVPAPSPGLKKPGRLNGREDKAWRLKNNLTQREASFDLPLPQAWAQEAAGKEEFFAAGYPSLLVLACVLFLQMGQTARTTARCRDLFTRSVLGYSQFHGRVFGNKE